MSSIDGLLDPFDRGNGAGSSTKLDDLIEEGSVFDNGWASNAATTFDPKDSPMHKKRFDRLYDLHQGKGESQRYGDIHTSHLENDMETFFSVLELPEKQREITRRIIDTMDISSQNFGGVRYEKIILTTCSLVADEALSQHNGNFEDRLFPVRHIQGADDHN